MNLKLEISMTVTNLLSIQFLIVNLIHIKSAKQLKIISYTFNVSYIFFIIYTRYHHLFIFIYFYKN